MGVTVVTWYKKAYEDEKAKFTGVLCPGSQTR